MSFYDLIEDIAFFSLGNIITDLSENVLVRQVRNVHIQE